MQVEGLSDEDAAAALAAAAADGNKKATPVTRVRPGHADLAGALKYGFNDVRNVLERASARETAARVAAGGIARAILAELGVDVWSFTAEVGGVALDPARATRSREEADASPLRCPDPDAEVAMIARIDEARSGGDTVGGVFEVVAHGLPIGIGSYVHWDRRLDAALAAAVMSINIVKGVEIGLGFEQTRRFGSAVHDVIEGRGEGGRWIHRSNNAGGLTGGITNGEPLVVRGAVKPISTLARPLPSRGPRHRRGRRQGPLRAVRHQRRPGRRRRRRGDGDADPGRRDARDVRREHDRPIHATRWSATSQRISTDGARAPRRAAAEATASSPDRVATGARPDRRGEAGSGGDD